MAKKPENKLADLFPKPITVPLLAGKKAIIPPITVQTMCEIDESEEGGLQKFMTDTFRNPLGNIPRISRVIFEMLENKADFEDLKDFRRHFDVNAVLKMVEGFTELFASSMPAMQAAAGALGKGKKSLGGSSSAASPSTTPATSSKTA